MMACTLHRIYMHLKPCKMQLELSSSEVKSNYIVYLHYASILKNTFKVSKEKIIRKNPTTNSNYKQLSLKDVTLKTYLS